MKLIETHCHLDYLKEFPVEEILDKAWQSGIEKIITISVDPDNLETVLSIANLHENVYCTQGVVHENWWLYRLERDYRQNAVRTCSRKLAKLR